MHSSRRLFDQVDPEPSLDFIWNLAWKAKVNCQAERRQQEENQVLACLLPLHTHAQCMLFMIACLQLD